MWFLLWKLFSKSEESWWRVFTCWEVRSFTRWCNAEECELSSSCPRRDELNSEGQKKKIRAVCVALITQSETQCRQRYESWETRARSAPCVELRTTQIIHKRAAPESTAEHKGSLCDCYYTSWHNTKKNEANRMKFLWCSRTEGQTSAGCRKGDKGRTEEKITLKTEWRREKQKKQRGRKEGQKNVRPLFKVHSEMALRYLQCLIWSSVLLTLDLTSLAANPQGHINSFNTESPQCAAAQSCKQAPEPKPGPYQTTFIQTRDKKGSETSTALRTNEASDLWNQTFN